MRQLRRALQAASRSAHVERFARSAPGVRGVVTRFVAGDGVDDALRAARRLHSANLSVSLAHLGEETRDARQARAAAGHYVELLDRLAETGLAHGTEVSVKLSALGLCRAGEQLAHDGAARVCATARAAGATVTLDMEHHTMVDSTLAILTQLRSAYPDVGAVLQAQLKRSESDCAALAYPGSRVRLCKGAYATPEPVAYRSAHEVDRSYVRCLATLMAGRGYPMVATHDPRILPIAASLAALNNREPEDFEYQMLYGVRPQHQRRLASAGARVRVYVPYGDQWYAYLVRRLAERPANLAFFLRAVTSRR